MTGSPEDAEDLAQDAFVKAYQNLAGFKGESGFGPWLYRLASNVCIDHLRKAKRRDQVSITYLDEAGTAIDMEIPDERCRPDDEAERREVRDTIQRGLNELPELHRTILVLREINGLSYEEIGDMLDITAGTVKSRISRARAALSNFLLLDGNFSARNSSKRYTE